MSVDLHIALNILSSLGAAILIGFYLVYFLPLSKHSDNQEVSELKGISVIICARNEQENLRVNLPHVLNQDYPQFEVVVVNDASWDDSSEVIRNLQGTHRNLELVEIDKDMKRRAGKKLALTLGIKKAQYDFFLFSDADCRPASNNWISGINKAYSSDIVLGFGRYERTRGLLNSLSRFDAFQAACLYLSKAKVGRAYMGVGRNMAYSREIYEQSGGFKSHYHIAAGDDDLFVNENATIGNVTISLRSETHTISQTQRSLSDWWRQKRRHIGVSKHYNKASKLWLSLHHLGQLFFYAGLAASLVFDSVCITLLVVFLAKTLIQLLVSNGIARQVGEKDLVVLLPVYEPMLLVFNAAVAVSVWKSKSVKWK